MAKTKQAPVVSREWDAMSQLMDVKAPQEVVARVGDMIWKREKEDGAPIIRIGSKKPNWVIKKGRDGEVYCNCPNWIFKHRQQLGVCKHMAFMELNGIELEEKK